MPGIKSTKKAFRKKIIISGVISGIVLVGLVNLGVIFFREDPEVVDVTSVAKTEKKDKETKQEEKDADSSQEEEDGDGEDNKDDKTDDISESEPDEIKYTFEEQRVEEPIVFGVETKEEINLPRGEIKILQAGIPGKRMITYRITYRNGALFSREEISSEVVAEPVSQINLVGTADFNIRTSYIQLYREAIVEREGATAAAFMILVNGKYYIDFWYDPVTWQRYAPASALEVVGGSFSYDGNNYSYQTGPVDDSFALNMAFCNEYGLACGSW